MGTDLVPLQISFCIFLSLTKSLIALPLANRQNTYTSTPDHFCTVPNSKTALVEITYMFCLATFGHNLSVIPPSCY